MKREWLVQKRGDRTQEDIAQESHVSRPLYTQIETGSRNPSVATAKSIAAAMGFNWTLFFEESSNVEKQRTAI